MFLGIRKKKRLSDLIYGGAYLGFTYLSGWMISGGRYMLCCVPLFLILSGTKEGLGRRLLLLSFAALHLAYTLFFLKGYAIM